MIQQYCTLLLSDKSLSPVIPIDGLSACRDSENEFNSKSVGSHVKDEGKVGESCLKSKWKEFTFLTGYGFIVETFPELPYPIHNYNSECPSQVPL